MAFENSTTYAPGVSVPKKKKQRMAGEAMSPDSNAGDANGAAGEVQTTDQSAIAAGFRNENERRLGTEEYDRLSGEGLQDADNGGRYSAKEVIAEMRGGRNGRTTEEMATYFQGLADDGTKFNARAQKFLSDRHGVTFGAGGGGGSDADETPAPTPTPDPGSDTTPTPTPTPSDQVKPPINIYPGAGGPGQTIVQDNDQTSTINGDNNTVTQTQDNSINSFGSYSSRVAQALRDKYTADITKFMRY